MGITSTIEWTDHTWNPWQGCTKVSPACTNCYMFRGMKRYGKDGSIVRRSAPQTFDLPLKRTRAGDYKIPAGSKVFTCSWSDWFHQQADEWRADAWDIVRQRPDLIFQIVTKRTERIADCLPPDWGDGWPNVWLIATVENQHWADIRIPQLLSVPAHVRGLSIEPMLGPIDLGFNRIWCRDCKKFHRQVTWNEASPCFRGEAYLQHMIDWVITGGETGPGARPWHPDWRRDIHQQCTDYGVAYFHKQHGDWIPVDHYDPFTHGEDSDRYEHRFLYTSENNEACGLPTSCFRVGRNSGRMLDGREWSEFPKVSTRKFSHV